MIRAVYEKQQLGHSRASDGCREKGVLFSKIRHIPSAVSHTFCYLHILHAQEICLSFRAVMYAFWQLSHFSFLSDKLLNVSGLTFVPGNIPYNSAVLFF
jgi:hypothetical protein